MKTRFCCFGLLFLGTLGLVSANEQQRQKIEQLECSSAGCEEEQTRSKNDAQGAVEEWQPAPEVFVECEEEGAEACEHLEASATDLTEENINYLFELLKPFTASDATENAAETKPASASN
ncbi:hypothetical protein [Pseudovibrio sp. FO-BEG1]|uniref:hypothetical protein n=1 Tax=Pseudovibrio sp. (strain FO-BEG1) TaxID=911045 RepID=UPI0011D1F8CA|nr:hypothetical protein [Pseudovibrio sp. FO-BEG1]